MHTFARNTHCTTNTTTSSSIPHTVTVGSFDSSDKFVRFHVPHVKPSLPTIAEHVIGAHLKQMRHFVGLSEAERTQ
jgi:hypothetical protein